MQGEFAPLMNERAKRRGHKEKFGSSALATGKQRDLNTVPATDAIAGHTRQIDCQLAIVDMQVFAERDRIRPGWR
jgi:hypothetical protein